MNRARLAGVAALILVWVGLVVLAARQEGRPVADPAGRPSTMFTDATGGRALLLAFQTVLGPGAAEQKRTPCDQLEWPEDGPDSLIVAGPPLPLGSSEAERLDAWLRRGGQLILASQDGWPVADEATTFLEGYGVTLQGGDEEAVVAPISPGGLRLRVRPGARWSGEYEVVARSGAQAVAVAVPVGQGRIVALADPWVGSNESLRQADNGLWLMRLVEGWGDGRVLFDEYHHGFDGATTLFGVAGRFLGSPWGWPFLQLSLAGILYATLCRRRLGRVQQLLPKRLTDPMLLLQARAGLLEAASAGRLALDQVCQNLTHQLRDPTGRPADLRELAGKGGPARASLERLLGTLERTQRSGQVTPRDLLESARLASSIREEMLGGS